METNELVNGSKWVHGNTYRPDVDTVVGVFAWGNLTPEQQKTELVLARGVWTREEVEARLYVVYTQAGRKGRISFNLEAYKATRYRSNEAMIDAYQAKRAPLKGLPGGRL